ncbi:pyruvate, phosphate dikinase [Vampirovibrio sp.]|uniref:pyruvate, phosphate dikinase n=1 Tax=Vampirovibrio sp. TaxID=2717857 RepID=UPI003594219B
MNIATQKNVYLLSDGDASMKDLLGSKGANLSEMARLGLPVPPGFILTTEVCNTYLRDGHTLPSGLMDEVRQALSTVEKSMNRRFGDPENPLLLSVRSGARISMPGMMETVLNLGLNEQTLRGLIRQSGDERFGYDTYRRFIQMFGSVVLGVNKDYFEDLLVYQKKQLGLVEDTDIPASVLRQVVDAYLEIILDQTGQPFPEDPMEQLRMAVESVFGSWLIPRAVAYRNHMKIDHTLGTAVNIQAMVFGNMGDNSATGVAFTRNPSTGEKELYGEYLINAQGEDVVAGIRTPKKLADMAVELPRLYQELSEIAYRLEHHYMDVQDMEFTVERGRLFMLQTRTGKRTVQAAVKIAVDMVHEGLLPVETALLRVEANQLSQLFLPAFNPLDKQKARQAGRLLATGLNASPGAATGMIVFDPGEAKTLAEAGEKIILTRLETCPDDVHGMLAAQGVLTARGGNTSHAAVVARGIGKPCVAGCEACKVDLKRETLTVRGKVLTKGSIVSIDGGTGEVFEGTIATQPPQITEELEHLLNWADETRRLGVRANADTPADARKAVEMGAKGIGLCRTEHMFMAEERLPVVREMILANTSEERRKALAQLLPMQHADFKGIFQAMNGYPVTIRLLDPPLHEFLPNRDEAYAELLRLEKADPYQDAVKFKHAVLAKIDELREVNPMMGFRGCRLGLVYPEIYEVQVRAIFEAACDILEEGGAVQPEIMIPLVGYAKELETIKVQLDAVAHEVMSRRGRWPTYLFGTMIEVPRAALVADQIAKHSQFFSFGTNDLTQLALGFSRDDSEGRFLARYLEKNIIPENPFETLDQGGVGLLMEMARDKGRQTQPDLKLGLCGEHGGEAKSVQFCHRIGLNYVSCSPFRIPVARLAAAQAVIFSRQALLPELGQPFSQVL